MEKMFKDEEILTIRKNLEDLCKKSDGVVQPDYDVDLNHSVVEPSLDKEDDGMHLLINSPKQNSAEMASRLLEYLIQLN